MAINDASGAPRADGQDSPEGRERAAAWQRGDTLERERAAGMATDHRVRQARIGRERLAVESRAFAALADNVRDYAIFLIDPDGVITYWGEGARLIKWWTKDQAEGAHLRLLYQSGGSQDGTAEEHLRLAAKRGEYTGEGERVRSDGSTFWAGITLTALRGEDGTLLGFAKVTRDLTARRAADSLLQAAALAAEEARVAAVAASAAKSGFLATMSHEIRTPVNAILGYHELLELEVDGPLTERQRQHLARSRASARHLLALIGEVLDFSRIEAEHVAVDRSAFRVGDAVGAAVGIVSPQAGGRKLQIADAVSGYAAGLAAWGDESRVRQILVNLLANAIKFTDSRGGEAGRVTVSAGTATTASPDAALTGAGPWVYVRVEDTGPGIAAERIEAIFEPFVQGDMTLTRIHGGTGLGLAISRRLARLMGGDVTARSEMGVGSTFFLWLPAAPVESLETGGLPGHGPDVNPATGHRDGEREAEREHAVRPAVGPLRDVADGLLGEIERVLRTYVSRIRSDPAIRSARGLEDAQIEDHLASFLADLTATLALVDVPAPTPNPAVVDGSVIQRVIAERHGVQRARLGWAEPEVRRGFTILREELAAALVRGAAAEISGPSAESRRDEAIRANEVVEQFVGVAERVSLATFREAAAESGEAAGTPG